MMSPPFCCSLLLRLVTTCHVAGNHEFSLSLDLDKLRTSELGLPLQQAQEGKLAHI